MRKNSGRTGRLGGIALAGILVISSAPAQTRVQKDLPSAGFAAVPPSGPCLGSKKDYLRARIRGAVRLDVDLRGAALSCEGGPRIDGSGMRLGFEGRVGPGKRRMRIVFGVDGAQEGRPGRELPTNLTVIFEGEKLLFATQGDGNCTVDRLTQKPVVIERPPTHAQRTQANIRSRMITPKARSYLVMAHGFCIAPANDLTGDRRILVSTFDFA